MRTCLPLILAFQAVLCLASAAPTLKLDNATVIGVTDGSTNSFLGIPYALPPIGNLRFALPQAVPTYSGTINATFWGNQCYNTYNIDGTPLPTWMTEAMIDYFGIFASLAPAPFDEDCLNLNVITPINMKPGRKLPVVAYIFFGGFDFSGSSNVDGRIMVNRSAVLGEPVIWVSMNYRLGAYGFLPGRQVREAGVGNLGLQDQREALRWIQKYAPAFGGDPDRVTLLGFSAGAESAALHTVANAGNNEGLFQGIWAESGALKHIGWIDDAISQDVYDSFASALNCSDAADSLQCLREIPTDVMKNLAEGSGSSYWLLTADGYFLQDLPQQSLVKGHVASVAIVTGMAEDDGTIGTLAFPDGGNDTTITNYLAGVYPNITTAEANKILQLYPDNATLGAPYGTGDQYELAPMWKRIGSILGDVVFDANHRLFATALSPQQPVWSYFYQRNFIYGFGYTHGCEIPNMYQGGDMADMLIQFANTFDPNIPKAKQFWPRYSPQEPIMLTFIGNDSFGYKYDNYRQEGIEYITNLNLNT